MNTKHFAETQEFYHSSVHRDQGALGSVVLLLWNTVGQYGISWDKWVSCG